MRYGGAFDKIIKIDKMANEQNERKPTDRYVLFIGRNYLGDKKWYIRTLREALNIIHAEGNECLHVRLQRLRKDREFWRILLSPENSDGDRTIQGDSNPALTDRVLYIMGYDKRQKIGQATALFIENSDG